MHIPVQTPSLRLSRQQISVLLTIIALLFWLYSILHVRFEIGYFGLIYGLPVTYFIALAFLTIASAILWVSREKHGKLLCLQLLILVSALWLIPSVTGGSTPVINHDYRNLGYIDYITREGHFSAVVSEYLSWPATFITSASISNIALVNLEALVAKGLVPFLMQLLYLAPLYVFLKNTLGEERSNYCWLGCWLFYLAQWVPHVHLNPQGFGFFLLLTLLALVTNPKIWQRYTESFRLLSLTVVIFAALAVTHLLTSLAFLCILIGLYLVRRDKRMVLVVMACVILIACWNLTGARGIVVERVEGGGAYWGLLVFDPGLIVEREVVLRVSGSQSHIAITNIRLLFSSIFALIGLVGVIMLCFFRRKFKLVIPLLIITLAPLILLTFSYQYGELLPRIYFFALPGMAFFGAMLLDVKKKVPVVIVCLLLIACCPLHVISRYGNQAFDYISPAQLSGVTFFHDRAEGGYVAGAWPIGLMRDIESYKQDTLEQAVWEDSRLVFTEDVLRNLPCYVSISRKDKARQELLKGNIEFINEIEQTLKTDTGCGFIYHNPDLGLYIYEKPLCGNGL